MKQKPKVFINYRRVDASANAQALYQMIINRNEFNKQNVFMDVNALRLGERYVESIEQTISDCSHLLVLIGPSWVNEINSRQERNSSLGIEDGDFVILEIALALSNGVQIVPILCDGAEMPSSIELPSEIRDICNFNSTSIRHESFIEDATRIIDGVLDSIGLENAREVLAEPSGKLPVPDSVVEAIRDQFETNSSNALSEERIASEEDAREAEQLKKKLLSDWRLVKRARFYAAKRVIKRHEAGQISLGIALIYGFIVPPFIAQLVGLVEPRAMTTMSLLVAFSGGLAYAVGLTYLSNDYKRRSASLHECGLKINNLSRHLMATPISRAEDLRPFIHHYDDILSACENHSAIDFGLARLTDNPKKLNPEDLADWKRERRKLNLQLFRETYMVCGIVWLIPFLVSAATITLMLYK